MGERMKSTNLYSGLAIILAAAANTAVVGCAGALETEDAIAAESSVQSVSSPCEEAQYDEQAPMDQPIQGSDQGAPCNGASERQGDYSAPSGGYGASQGGYEAPQRNYGAPQGSGDAPRGNSRAPRGNHGAPQGNYGAPQGGYDASQGDCGAPQGEEYGGYDDTVGGDESVPVGGGVATYPVPCYYPVLVSPYAFGLHGCGGFGGFGYGGLLRRWW